MFTFDFLLMLTLFSIFYLLTYCLPKEYLAEFTDRLRNVRGFVLMSFSANFLMGIGLYVESFEPVAIIAYYSLTIISVYFLLHSIVTSFESDLAKNIRLLSIIHVSSFTAFISYFVFVDTSPVLRQSFLFLNIILALFIGRRIIIKKSDSYTADKIFAYSLGAAILVYMAAIVIGMVSPSADKVASFNRLIQVTLFSAIFVLFGFMVNISFGLVSLLRNSVNTDRLTGVYNRNYFYDVAAKMLSFSDRQDMSTSLIICDIDNFKGINDTFGHIAGDMVLVSFSDLLKSQMRKQDVVIRLGGEEFLVMLPGQSLVKAKMVAERIRQEVEKELITIGNYDFTYTLSLGVTQVDTGVSVDENVANADSALYQAKRTGKNKVCVFIKENNKQITAA